MIQSVLRFRHILIAACAAVTFAAPVSAEITPPRSVALPESQVKDVFFSYVVGVLLQGLDLDVSGATLLEMFPEFADGSGQLPFRKIDHVTKVPGSTSDSAQITLTFTEDVKYPVPVDILGYHPGTVIFSKTIEFTETARPASGDLSVVREIRVRSGTVGIDFDQWLDTLLGGWVDDVDARVLAVVRFQDRWYGLLGGDTPNGRWITGVYDLESSRIVVRPPIELRELGRSLAHQTRIARTDPGDP